MSAWARFGHPRAGAIGLLALGLLAAAALATADEFLEQYAATYRFRLGRPTAWVVTPAGDAVLFLRSGPRSFVQDLVLHDVASGKERVLVTAAQLLAGDEERLTPEERARRERKRIAGRGIAAFELSRDGRRILVPLAGRLFVIERASGETREIANAGGAAEVPRLSPDGESIAFVRDGDLHVTAIAAGAGRRLTTREREDVTNGVAEFVAAEEMDRHEGFWWSPDSKSIAFEQADTRGVESFHIMDPAHPERAPASWPYPRPGGKNAEVRLGVVPAAGGPVVWVEWDRERYPYLASVRWEKNAPLTLLVQNRAQTEEALLAADPAGGATRALLIERDAAWLNLEQSVPAWLEDGSAFLWISERDGVPRLERRARDGAAVRALTPETLAVRELLDLDPAAGTAWVSASEIAKPTETHLWRVALDGKRAPVKMTREPGIHGARFSDGHGVFVHSFDALSGERRITVERAGRKGSANRSASWPDRTGLPRSVAGELRSVAETPVLQPRVEFARLGPRGLRAAIVRPREFDPARRYPVLAHVYGGPHSQMVQAFAGQYLLDQWFADHGFVVVLLDGRGTPARGREWERTIRGDFVSAPLADLAEGLEALAARHPEMDMARAGIWGWSFGGYFSAIAVMKRPDLFRAAVAGAPVVDWRDYDTHYTERYLGLPGENQECYAANSVLTWVKDLSRPLLVVHGTADDNVYFLHSMKLLDALNAAGRDYEFMPLVGHTHMVTDPASTARLYGRIVEFFRAHLAGPPGGAASGGAAGR